MKSPSKIFEHTKTRRAGQLVEMSPEKIDRLREKCFGRDRDTRFIREFLGLFARHHGPVELGRIAANQDWYEENHPHREEER